jgi:hypothetical protein
MDQLLEVRLQQQTLAAVQALAAQKHRTVDEIIDDAVQRGVSAMRQHLFFEQRLQRANGVLIEEVLQMLRESNNNPPDPGDELPDDLKYLLSQYNQ